MDKQFLELHKDFLEVTTKELNSISGGYYVPWSDYGSIVSGGEATGMGGIF